MAEITQRIFNSIAFCLWKSAPKMTTTMVRKCKNVRRTHFSLANGKYLKPIGFSLSRAVFIDRQWWVLLIFNHCHWHSSKSNSSNSFSISLSNPNKILHSHLNHLKLNCIFTHTLHSYSYMMKRECSHQNASLILNKMTRDSKEVEKVPGALWLFATKKKNGNFSPY